MGRLANSKRHPQGSLHEFGEERRLFRTLGIIEIVSVLPLGLLWARVMNLDRTKAACHTWKVGWIFRALRISGPIKMSSLSYKATKNAQGSLENCFVWIADAASGRISALMILSKKVLGAKYGPLCQHHTKNCSKLPVQHSSCSQVIENGRASYQAKNWRSRTCHHWQCPFLRLKYWYC
jgi:hypothetical protein